MGSGQPRSADGHEREEIDRTYGHLVAGADANERELLDAFDTDPRRLGRYVDAEDERDAA